MKASEIIPSTSYATGCTLRFPRVVALRDDKKWDDAFDLQQLKDLRSLCDGKVVACWLMSFLICSRVVLYCTYAARLDWMDALDG